MPSDAPLLIAYDGSDSAGVAIDEAARLFPGAVAIVVGSRGRSAVKSALLGSVSSGVVHHADVPVVVVPSR